MNDNLLGLSPRYDYSQASALLRIFNSNVKAVLLYVYKYTEDTKKNTDLHQQMPAQNTTPEVDRQGTQHYNLEIDQATTYRKLNKEEKMEVIGHTLRTPP